MKIQIPVLKGLNTSVSPRLIAKEQAQLSLNCDTREGNLKPLKQNDSVTTPTMVTAPIGTIFLYAETHWFSWNGDVYAVDSPIAQDQYQRVYFTGDGVPKYTNSSIATGGGALPFGEYLLGIEQPFQPSVTGITYYDQSADLGAGDDPANYLTDPNSGYIDIEDGDDETRFYVITHVSAYGEESLPSPVSGAVELQYHKDTVGLSFSQTGGFGNRNITKRRIYRTVTSSSDTDFYLVDEIPITQTTYTDSKQVTQLGALLSTEEYEPPPSNMDGIIVTSNGVVIGFAENEIIPSEPYLPYAYPLAYRQSLAHNVKALAEMSAGIVVATDDKPAIIQGVTPDSYSITVLDASFPCVSSRSMVDMGEAAIFASHDGLVAVSSGGASLITKELISRDHWNSLNPSTMKAYRYNTKYVCFYDNSAGFIFDLSNGDLTFLDFYATAGFFDSANGKLYLIVNNLMVTLDQGASSLTYQWQSKDFELNGAAISTMQVTGVDLEDTQAEVFYDDVSVLTKTLVGFNDAFRLPSGRPEKVSVKLTGTAEIKTISLATSFGELRNA